MALQWPGLVAPQVADHDHSFGIVHSLFLICLEAFSCKSLTKQSIYNTIAHILFEIDYHGRINMVWLRSQAPNFSGGAWEQGYLFWDTAPIVCLSCVYHVSTGCYGTWPSLPAFPLCICIQWNPSWRTPPEKQTPHGQFHKSQLSFHSLQYLSTPE